MPGKAVQNPAGKGWRPTPPSEEYKNNKRWHTHCTYKKDGKCTSARPYCEYRDNSKNCTQDA